MTAESSRGREQSCNTQPGSSSERGQRGCVCLGFWESQAVRRPVTHWSSCQTWPRPYPPVLLSFAKQGNTTTGNKTAHARLKMRTRCIFTFLRFGVGAWRLTCCFQVVKEPEPLGAERQDFSGASYVGRRLASLQLPAVKRNRSCCSWARAQHPGLERRPWGCPSLRAAQTFLPPPRGASPASAHLSERPCPSWPSVLLLSWNVCTQGHSAPFPSVSSPGGQNPTTQTSKEDAYSSDIFACERKKFEYIWFLTVLGMYEPVSKWGFIFSRWIQLRTSDPPGSLYSKCGPT